MYRSSSSPHLLSISICRPQQASQQPQPHVHVIGSDDVRQNMDTPTAESTKPDTIDNPFEQIIQKFYTPVARSLHKRDYATNKGSLASGAQRVLIKEKQSLVSVRHHVVHTGVVTPKTVTPHRSSSNTAHVHFMKPTEAYKYVYRFVFKLECS